MLFRNASVPEKKCGKSRLLCWLSVFCFCFFAPACGISLFVYYYFGRLRFEQIAFHCWPENIACWPRIYLLFLILFALLSFLICACYARLVLAASCRARLMALPARSRRLLRLLNVLLLAVLVELTLWQWFPDGLWGRSSAETERKAADGWEKQYFPVEQADFHFPEQRMNLIHLVVSSWDDALTDPESYGCNLMPELVALAAEKDSFPACVTVSGTDCLGMALVASQCGMPFQRRKKVGWRKLPGSRPRSGDDTPHLFRILSEAGYHTGFFCRSGGISGVQKAFYEKIPGICMELPELKNDGSETGDAVLLGGLRQLCADWQETKEPFAVQAVLMDAWCPGPLPEYGGSRSFRHFQHAVRKQDRIIMEFLDWLKKQDCFSRTVVVITGDCGAVFRNLDVPQSIYNCVINGVPFPRRNLLHARRRPWAMFDLFPTILEAMDVTWQHHRLGVGVSLFSEDNTWLERIEVQGYEREAAHAPWLPAK